MSFTLDIFILDVMYMHGWIKHHIQSFEIAFQSLMDGYGIQIEMIPPDEVAQMNVYRMQNAQLLK